LKDHTGTFPAKSDIEDAAKRIRNHVHYTPVLTSQNLDSIFGCHLYFKCENFQKAGAFKSRGAVNKVFSLSNDEIKNGVCTHSSGNHAAALARAAMLRGIDAHIVMPENSSTVKIEAVKHYGGKITFCKPTLDARELTLRQVKNRTKAFEVHPYNDFDIISGQGTAAMELFQETGAPDIIMAPVGGGGLLSGTALATHYFSPGTKIIGAEPARADDAFRSFKAKTFYPSENPDTIADGLRTSLGNLTFPIILQHVDDIVTTSEEAIIKAMKLIWERMKIIVEPSSAVPLAAILENKPDCRNKNVAIILSGGNVDLTSLPW
jgi:threonine dehydratase